MEPGSLHGFSSEWTAENTKPVLPHQPRFLHELAVIPLRDGLVVDGADGLQFFKGPRAESFLPRLMSLMDGDRNTKADRGRVCRYACGSRTSWVFAAFQMWTGRKRARPKQRQRFQTSRRLRFLRRYGATTAANCSGLHAYGRLRTAQVVIFYRREASLQTEVLKLILEKSGIGGVVLVLTESLGAWYPRADTFEQSLAVSLSFEREDVEWHAQLDDWCVTHGMSWLRAAMDEAANYLDVGPLFRGKDTLATVVSVRCISERVAHAVSSQRKHKLTSAFG